MWLMIASQESRLIRQRNSQPTAMAGDSGGAEPRCVRSESVSRGQGWGENQSVYELPCHRWLLPPSDHQIFTSRTPRSRGVNFGVLVEPVRINPGAFITRGAAQLTHDYHSRYPFAHLFVPHLSTRFRCPRTTMSSAVPLGRFSGCGVR